MGILNNHKKEDSHYSTKNFYFGTPEAEGEVRAGYKLLDYFDDYLGVLEELEKGKFIFVGRKGSGKTAIAKYIKDKSDDADDSFASLLRLKDFHLEKNLQLSNDATIDTEAQLFEWLILINIVKLIVKNECGQYTNEYDKLKKFVERNTGSVDIDKFEVSTVFKKTGGEVNFGVLTHSFGGIFKKYFDVKTTKAPYYKLITPLKEIVKNILDYPVNREFEFWLLFDDLDVGYDVNNENDNAKIMELLRIAKQYNTEVFQNNNSRILIFLRDDVRDVLKSKYNDSGKVFLSYEIPLNWYNHKLLSDYENVIPLKKLTNKRLTVNFKNINYDFNDDDPWQTLFPFEYGDKYTENKTSFKYILDFTLYRPRDIIIFLSVICEDNYKLPIDFETLKTILYKYINKLRIEIESELSLFFDTNDKGAIFGVLGYIANNYYCKRKDVIAEINRRHFSFASEKVLSILEDYSLLGYRNDNGDMYFKCREQVLNEEEKNSLYMIVPRCILHHFKKIYTRY